MRKSSTSGQNSNIFKWINYQIKSKNKSIQSSKNPISENSKSQMVPIISQKRTQKIRRKAMFSNNRWKDIIQPQYSELSDQKIFINQSPHEDEEEKNAYLLQIMRNKTYLQNKRNRHRQVKSEGISIWNPQKNSQVFEQQNQDQSINGLNKFTNIYIKQLQKKCQKVSFSQFLQDKKQQDYLKKFRYNSSNKYSSKVGGRNQNSHCGEQIRLKGINSKNNHSQIVEQNLNKHSKSVILTEGRKKMTKNRIYSKVHERYHSISGLNESLGINSSLLEISQIRGCL